MGRFAASGPKGFKPDVLQARSSGVERYIDTVEVGGSKPPVPTISNRRYHPPQAGPMDICVVGDAFLI